MNKGLVVGKVFTNKGNLKSGAEVLLHRVDGGSQQLNDKRFSGSTDSKGQFSIPFEWSGTGFADDVSVITLLISASVEHNLSSLSTAWTIGRTTTRGMLMRDVKGLMMVPLNDIIAAVKSTDIPGILDFLQDFIAGYRKFAAYPFWKTGQLSTESWLILGGANIFLNQTPYIKD
jgi:hypothetical protein